MDRPITEAPGVRRLDELVRLLDAVSRGDREAFADLYKRTAAKLYGICVRLLRDKTEAQEVLQEAFVSIWRNARRFDASKASPITWLAVLTRNKALDRLRSRTSPTEDLSAASDIEDERPSAFAIVAQQQDTARLHRCLNELDARTQTMIRSAFLDGATYPELAEREGVPLGTMKSWIRRGLQRLRGCLEP